MAVVLALILAVALAPLAALADGEGHIALDKAVYAPNEDMLVAVTGITAQMVEDYAYVSIYRKGAAHSAYMSWKRPEAVGSSQLPFRAPAEPGAYEMRLYRRDYDYTDASFVMIVPFAVALQKQRSISLEKSEYLALQRIPVAVDGITPEMEQSGAFVSIYKKGAGHEEYGAYQYVTAGSSVVELTAPNLNGEFEMRLYGIDHNYSDESFVASLPFTLSGAVLQPVSEWARGEVARAAERGLIPDSLKEADLTGPITRAEFAAVSVKLYEKLSGTAALPAAVNPFQDTADTEVLKAYQAGITAGVEADRFAPNVLLNREQASTMLTRVFKKAFVAGWSLDRDASFVFQYAAPAKFADDADISDWAKPSVYFMAAHGIISGVGDNRFAPRAITTAQQAANYASATREQALAIAVRMTEKLDAAAAAEILPAPDQSEAPQVQPPTGDTLMGSWQNGSLTGHTYSAVTGTFQYNSGIGELYTFNADGSFASLIVAGYGNCVSIAGKYAAKDGRLSLTGQSGKLSSDYGNSWTTGNSPADTTRHYALGSDDIGPYLLIGLEGASLPLDTETNAVRYDLVVTP
ncbi:MAG: S-layer homology domain-containing protein [Clostridiales bacterium]|nr:S-layer homology domain-containing protein [Clostridiales bacterium]